MIYKDLKIKYQNKLGYNYLVVPLGSSANDYNMRILAENNIPQILEMHMAAIEGNAECYYEIKGKQTLEQYYSRRMLEFDDMKRIVESIAEVEKRLEEYLIGRGNILLSPETIFISQSDERLYFCVFPEEMEDYGEGLLSVAKFFLKKMNHQDERASGAGYQFFEMADMGEVDRDEMLGVFGANESADKENTTENADDLSDLYEDSSFDLLDDISIDDDVFDEDFAKEFEYDDEKKAGMDPIELLELNEDESKIDALKKKAIIAIPAAAFVFIAIFMFSDKMSDLSIGLRIGYLAMLAVAFSLAIILLKNKLEKN